MTEGYGNGNGNGNLIALLVIVDIHGRTGKIIHQNKNKSTFKNLDQLHAMNSVSIIVFHVFLFYCIPLLVLYTLYPCFVSC